MSDEVSGAVGGIIGSSAGNKFNQSYASRLKNQSRVECSIRVERGHLPALSERWTHGIANIAPGTVSFSPYLPPGIRVRNPFRERVNIEVVDVSSIGARVPRSFWGPRDAVSVTIKTAGASLEVAVPSTSGPWFVATVGPSA